jgi:hypothetical protein
MEVPSYGRYEIPTQGTLGSSPLIVSARQSHFLQDSINEQASVICQGIHHRSIASFNYFELHLNCVSHCLFVPTTKQGLR